MTSFTRSISSSSTTRKKGANRFHFEKDRRNFALARGALRILLGRQLNLGSESIRFDYNQYSKPSVHQNENNLEFNLSHSGNFAFIALSRSSPVGIDIEQQKTDIEHMDLAKRFFSPREYGNLVELPKSERLNGFCRCWTRKEAYIKAIGKGLLMPLDSFDVSLQPGRKPEIRSMTTTHRTTQNSSTLRQKAVTKLLLRRNTQSMKSR